MYKIGQRVYFELTGEHGTVLTVTPPDDGAIIATEYWYRVRWDLIGAIDWVDQSQIRPLGSSD